MDKFLKATYKTAKRVVIAIVGTTVILIGIIMIVLPGPAMVVIPAGLGILSLEFVWARRWLKKLKEKAQSAVDSVRGLRNNNTSAECDDAQRHRSEPPPPAMDRSKQDGDQRN